MLRGVIKDPGWQGSFRQGIVIICVPKTGKFKEGAPGDVFRATPGSDAHSFYPVNCYSPAGEARAGFEGQLLSVSAVAKLIHTPMV